MQHEGDGITVMSRQAWQIAAGVEVCANEARKATSDSVVGRLKRMSTCTGELEVGCQGPDPRRDAELSLCVCAMIHTLSAENFQNRAGSNLPCTLPRSFGGMIGMNGKDFFACCSAYIPWVGSSKIRRDTITIGDDEGAFPGSNPRATRPSEYTDDPTSVQGSQHRLIPQVKKVSATSTRSATTP